MSFQQYQLADRIIVPGALAAAHSTLPQQSIYVLKDTCSEELKLIRLLLGNVKISYSSDALFECVNKHIFNWLAVLFFETLKHRVYAPL